MDDSGSKETTIATKNSLSSPKLDIGEFLRDSRNDGSPSSPPKPTVHLSPMSKAFFRGVLLEYWWKAFVACLIMCCSLMAIVLILALHQNRPLPNWPFKININSLISIMVVILNSSMLAIVALGLAQTKWLWVEKPRPLTQYSLYDKVQASQGPLDAAQLLWVLRAQQWFATIGLVIIIVSLAMDPFTQQAIQYQESTIVSDNGGNATIPRTNVYNDNGTRIGARLNKTSTSMLGSVMAGFWTPGADSYTVTASNCFTGNCTFSEPYHTLSVCSSCTDTTSSISGFFNGTGPFDYTLPSGTTLSIPPYYPTVFMIANASGDGYSPNSTFVEREFIWTSVGGLGGCPNSSCPSRSCVGAGCNVNATSCYLYTCIKSYTANVTNGLLAEHLIDSVPTPHNRLQECWTSLRKDCLQPADWALLSTQGFHPNDTHDSDYLPYCLSTGGFGYGRYVNITPSCVYDFDLFSSISLDTFFSSDSRFNAGGFLNGALTGNEGPETADGAFDLLYLYGFGEATFDSVASAWESVASAMSTQFREYASATDVYHVPAQGLVLYAQTLIKVEWEWLILPFFLVTLTLVFFIFVVIQTSVHGRHPVDEAFSLELLSSGITRQSEEQSREWLGEELTLMPHGLFEEKKEEQTPELPQGLFEENKGYKKEQGKKYETKEENEKDKAVLIQMVRTENGKRKLLKT